MTFIPEGYVWAGSQMEYVHYGWLSQSVPAMGDPGLEFCEDLAHLVVHLTMHHYRTQHVCMICGAGQEVTFGGEMVRGLGDGQVFVPLNAGRSVYTAPTMILHYVLDHGYLPPRDFRNAVTRWRESDSVRELGAGRFSLSLFPIHGSYEYDVLLRAINDQTVEVHCGQRTQLHKYLREDLAFITGRRAVVLEGREDRISELTEKWYLMFRDYPGYSVVARAATDRMQASDSVIDIDGQ